MNNLRKSIINRPVIKHALFSVIFCFIALVAIFAFPLAAEAYYRAPFIKPVDGEIILSFRESYWDKSDKVERKHTGIDIAGNPGDKTTASGNGTISYTGISPIGGRTIVIKHNEKIRTTYLNLDQILVSPGTYIRQDDCIGTIGADDDPSSETTHLHFGIIYDNYYLNPEDILYIDYSSISRFLTLKYVSPDLGIELK